MRGWVCATALGLLGASSLAPAATPLSDEVALVDPTEGSLRPTLRRNAALARGPGGYLAVWEEYAGTQVELWAAPLGAGGELLDAAGIAVSAHPLGQLSPAVAAGDSEFLVAWEDFREVGLVRVRVARVSPAGVVLDAAGLALAPSPNSQHQPAVAFGGGQYLVAWSQGPPNAGNAYDVRAARISAAGVVRDAAPIAVSSRAGDQLAPTVASDGTDFLVAYDEGRTGGPPTVLVARVSAGGVVAGGDTVLSPFIGAHAPAAVFLNDYFVFYVDDRLQGASRVVFQRLAANGAVLDAAPVLLSRGPGNHLAPSPAVTGGEVHAAWERFDADGLSVQAARLSPAGAHLEAADVPLATGGAPRRPAAAGGWVAWEDEAAGELWHGPRGGASPQTLDVVGRRTHHAALAFDGAQYLVAWSDARGGKAEARAARVSAVGQVLDTTPLRLAPGRPAQRSMAVAAAPGGFLVAWEELPAPGASEILGARVSPAGALLDAAPLALSGAGTHRAPAVASDGVDHLVVYETHQPGGSNVRWVRVSAVGAVLGGGALAAPLAGRAPSIAFGGGQYLVSWEDTLPSGERQLRAARLLPDGSARDPQPLVLASGGGAREAAAVTWAGARFFVAWRDARGGEWDLYGARVEPDGSLPDGLGRPLVTGAGPQGRPVLGYDGTQLLLAWSDTRQGAPRLLSSCFVDLPTEQQLLAEGAGASGVAFAGANGRGLWLYTRALGLSMRFLGGQPNGGACGLDTDCLGGRCSTGLCCAEPSCALERRSGPPRFLSPAPTSATCNAPLRYQPEVVGEGPLRFAVAYDAPADAPGGLTVDGASGTLEWTPPRSQAGVKRVRLVATGARGRAEQPVELEVRCGPLTVKGCSAASGAPGLAVLVFVAARRRRRGR